MIIDKKWHKIDLIKLVGKLTYKEWNKYLDYCVQNKNVTSLASTYYGLQVGYQYAAFQKLVDTYIIQTFIHLHRSAQKALRRIYYAMFSKTCIHPLMTPEFKTLITRASPRDFVFERFFPGVYV